MKKYYWLFLFIILNTRDSKTSLLNTTYIKYITKIDKNKIEFSFNSGEDMILSVNDSNKTIKELINILETETK